MADADMRITVLGTRGSIPVSGPEYRLFGGATSCYMVEAGGETVFLDAGTGLISAPSDCPRPPVILLSHLHLDHLLGLGMYPRLSRPGARTRLMLTAVSAREAAAQLAGLFAPPFWPLPLTEYRGTLEITPLSPDFHVGEIHVECLAGSHPGGCIVFRLSFRGKRLVYATDYEPETESFAALLNFCRGADLVLYDAQYTEEEYSGTRGFGHSTAEAGLALLEQSGAKKLLLVHHSPYARDEELLDRERTLGRAHVRFAREGEVFAL